MTAPAATATARRVLAGVIAFALAAVIVAPIALSSGDLVAWATSPKGLGLPWPWPLVVFVALDAAAAVCVGFVVYSAWRGESAGAFGLLVWVFAGGSAAANYRHGQTTPAPDDAVFFAAMSVAGPLLLHMTVHRIRRWTQIAAGGHMPARAHFGLRWLPGVAFGETLAAWKASVRAGISRPEVAIAYIRERRLLAELEDAAAIRYAVGASGSTDLHEVWVWLSERGLIVDAEVLEQALGGLASGPGPATSVLRPPVERPALAAAPVAASRPTVRAKRTSAKARRGGRTDKAAEFILQQRAAGAERPEDLHIQLHRDFGLERTQARRFAERHWPISGPTGGAQVVGEGAA